MGPFDYLFSFYGLLLGIAVANVAIGFADMWRDCEKIRVGNCPPLVASSVLFGGMNVWLEMWHSRPYLTVDGIHTYHVGQAEILVHNDCGLLLSYKQGARMTTPQATELANWLGYTRVKGATSHGQAVYTNGKNFISPDVDSHSRGVWKMASSLNGFGANQRLGTISCFNALPNDEEY